MPWFVSTEDRRKYSKYFDQFAIRGIYIYFLFQCDSMTEYSTNLMIYLNDYYYFHQTSLGKPQLFVQEEKLRISS